MLSNIWDTKYEMHSSLADIEPHAKFQQCAMVVPTITALEKMASWINQVWFVDFMHFASGAWHTPSHTEPCRAVY